MLVGSEEARMKSDHPLSHGAAGQLPGWKRHHSLQRDGEV